MPNAHGKSIDKTFLSVTNAEKRGFIHRDYIAHCLRWSHVIKLIAKKGLYKTARVLDIGCGKEAPLATMLYSSRMFPAFYLGLDYGKIETQVLGKFQGQAEFCSNIDFAKKELARQYNFIVCFEVLEHVEPEHCIEILKGIKKVASDDATILISTPNWNGQDTAKNHVNEMRYRTLYWVFQKLGLEVQEVYGTFASQCDIEGVLDTSEHSTYSKLKEYYDSNLLSCLFAPLHPEYSRNCLWVLSKNTLTASIPTTYGFEHITEPWSSSEKWEDLKNAH